MFDIKMLGMVPPPFGGVSVYVKRLIFQLRKDGFSVGGYYGSSCEDSGIKSSKMFHKWTWMQTVLFPIKVWKYLIETSEYRIVHSHFSLEGMAYLWAIKTIGKKKVIVTIHNSMNQSYYSRTNPVNRFFLNKMLMSGDVTWITVSEEGKKQMESFTIIPVSPVLVIPAYIPPALSSSILSESMQSYIQNHSKNLVFYGHSFMSHAGLDVYGFERMLSAYVRIHNKYGNSVGLVYCITEISNQAAIDSLLRKANELGIRDDIFWQLGSISSMSPIWERADVYVRPTSTDGDSVAVREALSLGCQVVTSNVCERPKGCLLFDFTLEDDLFNVIELALQAGRRSVEQDYSFYHKMKDVYDSILNCNT